MEEIYCENIKELKREKNYLERELKVKITIKGRKITIDGPALEEYETSIIFEAISLGFSARTACLLKDESFVFKKINIKDFTRRKNLSIIRARLIGTHGKTKSTIEQIAGCKIKIKDNLVGIICPAENIEYALTAITNIIRGTKQTNAYKYLERINTQRNRTNSKKE